MISDLPVVLFSTVLLCVLVASDVKSKAVPVGLCEDYMSVVMHYALVLDNGSAWDPVGRSLYPPGTYWFDEREIVLRGGGVARWAAYKGCPCMLERPCLRKCCPVGESLDEVGDCKPSDPHLFSPILTEDDGSNPRAVDADENYGVLFGLNCSGMVMVDPEKHPKDKFFFRASDGSMSLPLRNVNTVLPSDYCLDYVHGKGVYLPLLCDRARQGFAVDHVPEWLVYALSLPLLLSTSFLLATFFAFALTPDLRRSLHGKSVMCLVTCLLMGYVFLAMVQLAGKGLTKNNCIASAFVMQFSFHAAFFWLNAMCFDSCRALRGLKPNPSLVTKREERKFIQYSIYAWGLPLIIVAVGVIMDFYPGLPENIIRPKFGEARCWFHTKGGALTYFYGPMAVLLSCNIIMFAVTAVKIMREKKEPAILRITVNRQHDETYKKNIHRFMLYLKLFITMAINWSMELISWTVGGPDIFWNITDVGYTLQGFLFFIFLVWQDRVRYVLLKKLRICSSDDGMQGTTVRVI